MGGTRPCPVEQHIVRTHAGKPDTVRVRDGACGHNMFTFSNKAGFGGRVNGIRLTGIRRALSAPT